MKLLNNPTKIAIDFNQFNNKDVTAFLSEFGVHLKSILNMKDEEQIQVSKIWLNNKTYDKFKDVLLETMSKSLKSKRKAKQMLSFACLEIAPACDCDNDFNLEDDFIYAEEDCIAIQRIQDDN